MFSHASHQMHTEVSAAAPRNQPSVPAEPPIKNGPSGLETKRKVVYAGMAGYNSSRADSPEIVDVGSSIFGRKVRLYSQ